MVWPDEESKGHSDGYYFMAALFNFAGDNHIVL